jgi:hypothetical protein
MHGFLTSVLHSLQYADSLCYLLRIRCSRRTDGLPQFRHEIRGVFYCGGATGLRATVQFREAARSSQCEIPESAQTQGRSAPCGDPGQIASRCVLWRRCCLWAAGLRNYLPIAGLVLDLQKLMEVWGPYGTQFSVS